LATVKRWPPAPWVGAILSLCYLILVSVCFSTSMITFGGLLDEPNDRWVVWCLLIVVGSTTLLAYVVALVAWRAGRHGNR
jgi:hypothetical protein